MNLSFFAALLLLTASAAAQGVKRLYVTNVDGDNRRYLVHEPRNYTGQTPRPVVFMLHGTTGNGNKFYNVSGWKELGDTLDILTVFSSSWEYNIIEYGIPRRTTKWNCYPTSFTYAAGEVPRDDIKFLNRVLDEMITRYNVDTNRVYMAGFSNGGQMAFRCAVEMGNRLAAVVEASGSVTRDTTLVPQRLLPITFQIGNSDDIYIGSLAPYGWTGDFPMNIDSMVRYIPPFGNIVRSHINTFALDTAFTLTSGPNFQLAAYPGLSGNTNNVFRFLLLKGMNHVYPNGVNYPFYGAAVHWAWMRQFTLH